MADRRDDSLKVLPNPVVLFNKTQCALLHLDKAFEQFPLKALKYNQISLRKPKCIIFCCTAFILSVSIWLLSLCMLTRLWPVSAGGARGGGGDVGHEGSLSLASGTGLTMNLRPAECTTCAAGQGGMSGNRWKRHSVRQLTVIKL